MSKYAFFALYSLFIVVAFITRDRFLLQSNSWLRQRYAHIPLLMLAHGIPGAVALFLGIFQFSDRLRARFLNLHRWMGRIYVFSVAIAAPLSVVVAMKLSGTQMVLQPTLQSSAWIFTTAVGLYCVRTGRIQQHREWMMRSYPFAMVFVVVRSLEGIPGVGHTGPLRHEIVWCLFALAAFLPSVVIELHHMAVNRRPAKSRAAAQPSAVVL